MEQYIKTKIDEYVILLEKCGFVSNIKKINEIRNKLNSLKIKRIYNAPGDATINGDTLMICLENIELKIREKGIYYIDEVLFHEFSHIINSFHNAIYGTNKFIIRDYIQEKMNNFTTIELLEQNEDLLYNQDPCFGVVLIDEFISQTIAQNLVLDKFNNLNFDAKSKYVLEGNLSCYKERSYTFNICEPPVTLKTSLDDYPEFDVLARKFINKYKYSISEFIINSLNEEFLKDFINELGSDKMDSLYKDLCYLGVIQQRVYLLKRLTNISDKKDPANDPKRVYSTIRKILLP